MAKEKPVVAVAGGVTLEQVQVLIVGAQEELKTLIAATFKDGLTAERVIMLIDEKTSTFISNDALQTMLAEMTSPFITADAVKTLIAEANTAIPGVTVIHPPALLTQEVTGTVKPPFDPEWLIGLTTRNGKQELQGIDVLDYSVTGDIITIVTTEGVKHAVEI